MIDNLTARTGCHLDVAQPLTIGYVRALREPNRLRRHAGGIRPYVAKILKCPKPMGYETPTRLPWRPSAPVLASVRVEVLGAVAEVGAKDRVDECFADEFAVAVG
jgi:hypothetical protein